MSFLVYSPIALLAILYAWSAIEFCYLINTEPMQCNLKECIKRRVMKSLSANPYCFGAGKAAMESVWDVCYNDTEPYDRAP